MNEALEEIHDDLRGLIGRSLAGRYRVDALLGIGGMGAVFRGHHLWLRRDVAIKVLHPELGRDSQTSARFDREAQSASRLDHPNCLQVTDFGSTPEGTKYMVMQLLEGSELGTLLGEPLPPARAVELALQILSGLEHAHERGVVHRDLKPENVIVTADHRGRETLKIVDFGIAKIMEGGDGLEPMTRIGLVFGTPQYMSPEQAAGMDIDARSDLYSTGILLYQMVAGRPPFIADDPIALVRMQVSADPPPLPDAVPESLRLVILHMLAKQRDERFADARSAREALEEIQVELGGGPPAPIGATRRILRAAMDPEWLARTMPPTVTELPRRRPVLLLGVLGLGLAGAVWYVRETGDGLGVLQRIATEAGKAATAGPGLAAGIAQAAEADLAEIDRLLVAKDGKSAAMLLQKLRDDFPEDPLLRWRQGRLENLQRRDKGPALAAYTQALERDPALLGDKDFYGELMALLREPKLQNDAVDVALRHMGEQGHPFLLEQVNLDKRPLGYHDRHRALDRLDADPKSASKIERKLNLTLDVQQAKDSLEPCRNYRKALEAVRASQDPEYLPVLERTPAPAQRPGEAQAEEIAACEGLPALRQTVIDELTAKAAPVAAADGELAADGKAPATEDAKKSGRRGSKSSRKGSGSGCQSFAGIFRKGCRR